MPYLNSIQGYFNLLTLAVLRLIALVLPPSPSLAPDPSVLALAAAAMAASASLAPRGSARFSGLSLVRLPHASACSLRLRLPLRPARCQPCVLVRASQPVPASQENNTFAAIQNIIAEQLAIGKETITPESKFTELGADSLDTVEIMMALEEKFDIQFEQQAGEKIQTVSNAVELIDTVRATK